MSSERAGKIHDIQEIMDRFIYHDILETKLIGTICMQGLEEENINF